MTYARSLRSTAGTYSSEVAITIGTMRTWNKTETRGVIFCHGSGDDAGATLYRADMRGLIYDLARNGTVQSGDWALQSFGNDASITSVGAGVSRLRTDWGVTGKVAVVGVSMGGCVALNYAVNHPENVACVAAPIGLTDLGSLYDTETGYDAQIDTAYGGSFTSEDRAAHSPIAFVDDLPADMPIALWTSTNDPIVNPDWHAAFVAARPQTEQTFMGPLGHAFSTTAAAQVAAWVAEQMAA